MTPTCMSLLGGFRKITFGVPILLLIMHKKSKTPRVRLLTRKMALVYVIKLAFMSSRKIK